MEFPPPYNVVIPTEYGPMVVNRNDLNQTNALFKTGRAVDHADITLLSGILGSLGSDHVFVDIGANFGTYTMAMARVVGPRGKVHAFEAQRLIFNTLVGSVALNSFEHVHCHNMAVGGHIGEIEIPQFNYNEPMNFGSVEFGSEQRELLPQSRQHRPERVEMVPLVTLDSFAFPRVDMIKIDVEGMEMEVLDGAEETLRRCRPILYIEVLKVDPVKLRQRIEAMGYLVIPNNINYFCAPRDFADRIVGHMAPM